MFSREDCVFTLNKYGKLLNKIETPYFVYTPLAFNAWGVEELNREIFDSYKRLKVLLVTLINSRYNKYCYNRNKHIPNKTSDKEFYRFMNASGFSEKNLMELPINRLICVYNVYFGGC